MGGFDHGPNVADTSESPAASIRNSRYGLILFAIYLGLYIGFILLNAFAPKFMERPLLLGLNLSIVYGLSLLGAALLLALIYGWLCSRSFPAGPETTASKEQGP